MPPVGGRVRVGAQQRLAGDTEAFKVHLVADAVAGTGEVHAFGGGDRLQVQVVVHVLRTVLRGVVVDVGHRQLRLRPLDPYRLKLQIRHRARGVLRQRLVYPYRHRLTGHGRARHKMSVKYFLRNCPLRHFQPLSLMCYQCGFCGVTLFLRWVEINGNRVRGSGFRNFHNLNRTLNLNLFLDRYGIKSKIKIKSKILKSCGEAEFNAFP